MLEGVGRSQLVEPVGIILAPIVMAAAIVVYRWARERQEEYRAARVAEHVPTDSGTAPAPETLADPNQHQRLRFMMQVL